MRGATPPVRLPYLSSYPLPSELALQYRRPYNNPARISYDLLYSNPKSSAQYLASFTPYILTRSRNMSSGGTGSEIEADDANDLLHSDGKVCVAASWEFCSPQFIFSPRLAVSRKYADKRAFPPPSRRLEEAGAPSVESGLCFVFEDGSQLVLFEIGDPS